MLRHYLWHRSPDEKDSGGQGIILKAISDLGTEQKKQLKESEEAQKKALEEAKKILEEDLGKAKAQAAAAEKKADDLEKKMGTSQFQVGPARIKSFFDEVGEKLEASKADLKKRSPFDFEMDRKAVGDLSSAGNLSGTLFLSPDVRPGVVLTPYEETHMRQLLPNGSTSTNLIRHVRDNGGEGGPGMVAEGAQKPQMDRDLTVEDAPVRKVATWLRVPEEMIEDIPYLQSFLTNIGIQEVMVVEDQQILYGDGTGQNLEGIVTVATAFAAGTSVIPTPNRYDVLRAARKQMRLAKRRPTFYLVSPEDYFIMTSAKDSTGNYILLGGGNGIFPNLDGVLLVEHTAMEAGDFLAGDRNAAEIVFRSNIQVRFYEQDRDNPIKNLVTIVIEERLALPIYYANGFVTGTFAAAITDLTS